MDKNKECFHINEGNFTLTLENLMFKVNVVSGLTNMIEVEVKGDRGIEKSVEIKQLPNGMKISGKSESSAVTMNFFSNIQAGGDINISNIQISSGNNSVVIGSVIGQVNINDNGYQIDGVTISGGSELPTILVKVPVGICIKAKGMISELKVAGINGKVYLDLRSGSKVDLYNINHLKTDSSGGCKINVMDVKGSLDLTGSGGTVFTIHGNFENINVIVSGGSIATLYGNCGNFIANASGGSRVFLYGKPSGCDRRNSSGGSSISIY